MAYFSNDASSDTINRIRGEISEVKSIMVENIEKVNAINLSIGKFAGNST